MKIKKLLIDGPIASELKKLNTPGVLRYDISRITWFLYKKQSYDGQELNLRSSTLDPRSLRRIETKLLNLGILRTLSGITVSAGYGFIGGNANDRNALICSFDPFCYLSHLSAMEFHGLTDRMPEQIYASTPAGTAWTVFANERMKKDFGEDWLEYSKSGLPQLQRTALTKIGNRTVHLYTSVHRGAFKTIKDSPVRVSTLGRTFLDMLREPNLCGGITHVLQVFKAYAVANKRLIFDEIEQHGTKIDKVRAGFIFEEICQITDPQIDDWVACAARGGSRKLDPSADYDSHFSERWMLSLNVPDWRD